MCNKSRGHLNKTHLDKVKGEKKFQVMKIKLVHFTKKVSLTKVTFETKPNMKKEIILLFA